jgi:hypothetical protein
VPLSFGPAFSGLPRALLEWAGLALLILTVGILWAGLRWEDGDDEGDGP